MGKDQASMLLKDRFNPRYLAWGALAAGVVLVLVFVLLTSVIFGDQVAEIKETRTYRLIALFVMLALLVSLVFKSVMQKITGLELLIGFAASVALMVLLQLLDFEKEASTDMFDRGGSIPLAIADTMIPIAIMFLYLHIELIVREKPYLPRALLILGLGVPLTIGGICLLIYPGSETVQDFANLYFTAFAASVALIGLFGITVAFETFHKAAKRSMEWPSLILITGIVVLLASFVLKPLEGLFEPYEIHNVWILSLGICVILTSYVLEPQYAYALPYDCYQAMIIDTGGIALWEYSIHPLSDDPEASSTASLHSSAITAIQSLVKEIAAAEGNLRMIGLSDRHMLMRSRGSIVGVIIADRTSFFLNRGLQQFVDEFYETYEEEITNFMGNIEQFRPATKLLLKHLPFV